MIFGEINELLELVIIIPLMFLGIYIVYLIQKRTSR